jgi:hypothetical protein
MLLRLEWSTCPVLVGAGQTQPSGGVPAIIGPQLQANDGLTSASTECSSWQAMFFMS